MPASSVLPISTEAAVLRRTLDACGDAVRDTEVAVALLHGDVLHFVTDPLPLGGPSWARIAAAVQAVPGDQPATPEDEHALPLRVHGAVVGVLLARRPGRPFDVTEVALLRVIADRVAAAAENGRLHANLTELLAEYMSPDVASTLLADPDRSQLGGETRDVSVLFADLTGFTTFSERNDPAAVVALLNRLFAEAVPAIVEHGGTVSTFIGDAIMGLFGAPLAQPEHPLLAARAGLALQQATAGIVADRPDLPRFRVGIATGPATVGNVGSPRRRVFTAIGDTVNTAARLEAAAPPGSVVVNAETHAIIRAFAEVRPMGGLQVKGKANPVQAYELLRLRTDSEQRLGSRTVAISLDDLRRAEGGG